ncbi:hypothetical protein MXD81_63595 [Microbacteriaceae bacterium K1510]|nr:hypothetical protein [Microbacteriaceae bacterium K1510]
MTAAPALTTPPANTDREGAFRIPHLARWPGVIRPGTVYELKAGDTADGIEVHLAGRDPSQQPDNRSAASTTRRAMTSIA